MSGGLEGIHAEDHKPYKKSYDFIPPVLVMKRAQSENSKIVSAKRIARRKGEREKFESTWSLLSGEKEIDADNADICTKTSSVSQNVSTHWCGTTHI